MPLTQLRSLVNAAVSDMLVTFDGYEYEIADWASGGWKGEQELKTKYCNAFDHSPAKIRDLMAFDTIITALRKREEEELRKALDRRSIPAVA